MLVYAVNFSIPAMVTLLEKTESASLVEAATTAAFHRELKFPQL